MKKELTEYRMDDYVHKAQYAEEVFKKRQRDIRQRRRETD